ncbi:hypothetical protein HDU67_004379, partial [Dinochytrium kinnereticum]
HADFFRNSQSPFPPRSPTVTTTTTGSSRPTSSAGGGAASTNTPTIVGPTTSARSSSAVVGVGVNFVLQGVGAVLVARVFAGVLGRV